MMSVSKRQPPRLAALLLALALATTGCSASKTDQPVGKTKLGKGVTEAPCPEAVTKDHGCIYLGIISDLSTGPFATLLAQPATDAQKAFWKRVNSQGGIGGFDIDVTRHIRDNHNNAQTHSQVYKEIRDSVFALAHTLGSATTAAIIPDMRADGIVAAPTSLTSAWLYEPGIIESGATYCIESMNAVDYAVAERNVKSVMAVHFPGDYGDDGAAGAKIAARAHALRFTSIEQTPKSQGGTSTAAIDAIVQQKPDLVILTVAPTETAEIISAAAADGYSGLFIGMSPTWNPALLQTPAGEAIRKLYLQSSPWGSFMSDTPGHKAMREALGTVTPNDGYTSGWIWSYPLKAALEQAVRSRDLTREGLLEAIEQINAVDYEGMLPAGAGHFAGEPNDEAFRANLVNKPDPSSPTGLTKVKDFFTGPTAQRYQFSKPCYHQESV
ncbi:MAG: ABC transporter substrate-binding protein [Egibacteraceae bacterium]